MKKTAYTKNILEVFLTILLITLIIITLGILVRPVDTDKMVVSINTFHDMPQNSIDVLGMGSSHMYRGMDPVLLKDTYGLSAYNYGVNNENGSTTLLCLKDALRTQHPRLVIIDTYLLDHIEKDTDMNDQIYYTRSISWFDGKAEYLHEAFGNNKQRYLSYFMPLCAFHDNWVNLSKDSFCINSFKTDIHSTLGYGKTSATKEAHIYNPEFVEETTPDTDSQKVMQEIIDVCKDNNIELLFITIPYSKTNRLKKAITEMADENGLNYIDYFDHLDELNLDEQTDFMDSDHLNDNGAKKLSTHLGAYILEQYPFLKY